MHGYIIKVMYLNWTEFDGDTTYAPATIAPALIPLR